VAESSAGEVARTGGEPHDWAGDASDPPKALVRPRSEGINQRRSTQLGDVSMLDDGLEFKKEIRTIFFFPSLQAVVWLPLKHIRI
jgi:hypothetical protein